MKGIIAKGKDIEKVLMELKTKKLVDDNYRFQKKDDELIIPVKDVLIEGYEVSDFEFEKKKIKLDFKEEVLKILEDEEKDLLKTAYDIVGNIAILEFDEPLKYKAKQIGEILLKCNPSIETVAIKKGIHEGTLRLQDYVVVAGKDTLETVHKENGCRLKLNIAKVYYSARSATERKRVYEQIIEGEIVMVMFSGCGPFTCTVAKNTFAKEVYAIELNELGYKYAEESIKLNKLKNVVNMQGDVRKICPELKEKELEFDRIIMPLPKTAEEFLPEAFMIAKEGTIIHLYDFKDEKEFPESTISQIEQYAKDAGIEYEILDSVKCGQFSPSIYRVCVDFKITKKN